MAGSSSNPTIPASLSILVPERLTRDNYRLWRTQVLPAIRVTQLEWFIDGSKITPVKTLEVEEDSKKITVPNPEYVVWRVRDQHMLTYMVTSLSREVLAKVASASMAVEMWEVISKTFASQSRLRILHLRN
jgi:hypothetical protein